MKIKAGWLTLGGIALAAGVIAYLLMRKRPSYAGGNVPQTAAPGRRYVLAPGGKYVREDVLTHTMTD